MKIKLNVLTNNGMGKLKKLLCELGELEINIRIPWDEEQLKRGEIYDLLTDKYAEGSSKEPQFEIEIKEEANTKLI